MKSAVFFKTHVWDEIVESNYKSLLAHVNHADVFVLFDNSSNEQPKHINDIVLANNSDVHAFGLVQQHGFWFNGDYQSLIAFLKMPIYEYYAFVEYDVLVSNDLDVILTRMHNENIDVIGQNIYDDPWVHEEECRPYYVGHEIKKSLFCISFFSRRALSAIYSRRLHQGAQKVKEGIQSWPIGEAVMRMEADLSGLIYRELIDFCDHLRLYDWLNALLVSYVESLTPARSFYHPVYNKEKFIKLRLQHSPRVSDLIIDNLRCERDHDLFCAAYHFPKNDKADKQKVLDAYRVTLGNERLSYIFDRIISTECSASQSSTGPYSVGEDEAKRALGAIPRGSYSIHTMKETDPWWVAELPQVEFVKSIYFYDRPDWSGGRTAKLFIAVGNELNSMEDVYYQEEDKLLLGLRIDLNKAIKFVKVGIRGEGMLHFDTCILTG